MPVRREALPAAAEPANLLGVFGNWSAYTTGTGSSQTFTFVFSDTQNALNLTGAYVVADAGTTTDTFVAKLDPALSPDRLAPIIKDAGLHLVLSDKALRPQ